MIAGALRVAQVNFAGLALKLAHLRVAEASAALLALSDAIHGEYERGKRAEAVLDYDDLIIKTNNLLLEAGAGAWVLFKIDGGIDHILVDEAQDTTPAQWVVIGAWRRSSSQASGRATSSRTVFAVGDEKQSIYCFQGADPGRFGAVGRHSSVSGCAPPMAASSGSSSIGRSARPTTFFRRSTACSPMTARARG